jgi:AP-4 complex subunit mu-1
MYFVLTTRHNVSPIMAIEFLNRVTQLIKDYCGILTEEAIRKNFVLIYEILDEILVRLVWSILC